MTITQRRERMNLQAIADLAQLADYTFAFLIRAVAGLGVADHLADGPVHVDALAARIGANPPALLRALRALATKNVFVESDEGVFGLTAVGDLLREDHPFSMKSFFRLEPDVRALAELEYCVRTGNSAFRGLFDADYFEWLAGNDHLRERFHASQAALNRLELPMLMRAFRWRDIGTLVDVGGNDGSFAAALLARHQEMRATVFDLPDTVAEAERTFRDAGVSDRGAVAPGDLLGLGAVPAGADVYTVKRVLVGFSDVDATTALRSIRAAMRPDSRVLVIEPMCTANDHVGVSLDVLMLVLGAGRVRTPDEFGALFAAAGLRLSSIADAGLLTVAEGRPDAAA